MPTYVVYEDDISAPFLVMKAESKDHTPEVLDGGEEWVRDYANDLIRFGGLSVSGIVSKLGSYDPPKVAILGDDAEPLSKADVLYKVKAEQTMTDAGILVVNGDTGMLAGYVGDNPPVGYDEDLSLDEYRDQNRGMVLEPLEPLETEDQEEVEITTGGSMSDAQVVGEAVGTALVAAGLISKADEEDQVVYGWAYVTHDRDGNVVVDKSGEFVDQIREIEKSALRFMLTSRAGDVDHSNVQTTTIVESMVFTPEKCEAMGIAKGTLPSGWWIGAKCDDSTWADYKSGRLRAFSVHGKGIRKRVDE